MYFTKEAITKGLYIHATRGNTSPPIYRYLYVRHQTPPLAFGVRRPSNEAFSRKLSKQSFNATASTLCLGCSMFGLSTFRHRGPLGVVENAATWQWKTCRFDKSAEDLSYAIKISSLEATSYQLLIERARHSFQLYHVVEATKAWHPKEPKSAEILQRLLWRWLYNAETTAEKQRGIVRCLKVALKQHGLGLRAMQILWSTQVIPYTQDEFTIPQPQSIQEFIALDLLPTECYDTYRPHVTTRLRIDYIRAATQVASATDKDGNRLYKQPVAIRAVHRPGDKPKYVVDA
ncbi:hypothetical protein LEN26_002412 [Aphanomyces euteiches]|nr:hypothetical protein AeMF1_016532 [Aphanomyces euteiches]KAH9159307.1 hypothetical protein LEN26_002412 [Aphanomyces euteiches]KAH9184203.1 hypothetical protein AeNC1_013823 [Aphanomyces euteiches]